MPDLPPRPVLDGTAEIDGEIWGEFNFWKNYVSEGEECLRIAEAKIRAKAGNARYLTVNGQRVAVRIIQDAAGVSFRKDFYRKIGKADTDA